MRPEGGLHGLVDRLESQVLGQGDLIRRLLVAVLSDGHVLVEGPPGLAKTRAVRKLAEGIAAGFRRIQFTPDLLPSDLTGGEVYDPREGGFHFVPGPVFNEVILADEINRAPAKVQSALLEAMGERQVTIGTETRPLPPLFLVVATQNPIEHEGTYPLPEAQLDRFMLHVRVDYPDAETERRVVALARTEAAEAAEADAPPAVDPAEILAARREVLALHMAPALDEYVVSLVAATRDPGAHDESLRGAVRFGASPRAAIALDRGARALAWLDGRDYVAPDDIRALAPDVLRHRLVLSYEAEADGVTTDSVVRSLLDRVPVP